MAKMLNLIGMTIGGWLGWAVGAKVSIFTAYVVSMVGTGVGLYVSMRVTRNLMP